ncbi:serine hydrolase domain-containing protein [Rhodanobacter sp. DHG33]|uniref:serine hydrolase n=1 Tax=Rhodanobacter sp. DHG33 TaxID=2775921 RepID=UPI0017838762|nr:beta-lactamase family protein [Rhodanobacter sp. DHG33]
MAFSRRDFLGGSAALAAALSIRPALAVGAAARPFRLAQDFDRAAESAIKAGACPGIGLQISLRGQPWYVRSYGLANLETQTPVVSGSIFRIGSLTKQFTAAMILRLQAQGSLSLDDAAAKYLPFFAKAPAFTLRELLNHTAGLHDDDTSDVPPSTNSQVDLAKAVSRQQKLFDFPPGTAWLYSNANYTVLGAVIEQVTNRPLADAASEMIFRPLELHATAFDTAAAVVPGRADGYTPIEGKPGAFAHAEFIDIAQTGGAGAMRSTTGDLCRWHHALFGNRLLDARHVRMMLTPGRLRDGRLSGSHRFSPADDRSYGDVQYGMGLLLPPPDHGRRSAMHYGFVNGYAACLETWLDEGLTTAILCNANMGPAMPFRDLRRLVREKLLPTLATA